MFLLSLFEHIKLHRICKRYGKLVGSLSAYPTNSLEYSYYTRLLEKEDFFLDYFNVDISPKDNVNPEKLSKKLRKSIENFRLKFSTLMMERRKISNELREIQIVLSNYLEEVDTQFG